MIKQSNLLGKIPSFSSGSRPPWQFWISLVALMCVVDNNNNNNNHHNPHRHSLLFCWAREADTRDHFLYHDNKVVMDYQQHMYTPHYVLEEKTSIHAEFADEMDFEDETNRRNNQSKASEDMTPYFLRDGYPIPRVVEWYSPWCGHCQNFVPKYTAIAEQVLQRLPPHSVEFHAISCHEHRYLCHQFHIKGYPTIRAYPARAKDGIDLKVFTVRSISDILGLGITNSHAIKSVNERLDTTTTTTLSSSTLHTPASSPTTTPSPDNQQQDSSWQRDGDDFAISPKVDIIGASHDGHRHTRTDVYNDAARSFTYALEHHIFQSGQQALTSHQADTLSDWLDLLYWTLPPTWMIHTLIHDLRRNIKDIVRSKELFMTVFEQQRRVVHHDDLQWSDVCQEHGDGYSCGLWNLFHIMSVGVTERHRSVLGVRERITTRHAAEALKNYIDHFFPFCPKCRENFLNSYHTCAYRHCRRFRQRTKNNRTPPSQASWNEFPLWLWEVHNGIRAELLQNSTAGLDRPLSPAELRRVHWPSWGECHLCYKKNGNWDKKQVLNYLKEEYWPSGVHNFRFVVLSRNDASYIDNQDVYWDQMLKIGVPVGVSIIGLVIIWWRKRQRETFVAKGLHKKYY